MSLSWQLQTLLYPALIPGAPVLWLTSASVNATSIGAMSLCCKWLQNLTDKRMASIARALCALGQGKGEMKVSWVQHHCGGSRGGRTTVSSVGMSCFPAQVSG